jgi:hypothetical protein
MLSPLPDAFAGFLNDSMYAERQGDHMRFMILPSIPKMKKVGSGPSPNLPQNK